jgi:tRNA-dihydrouridine synthase
MTAEANLSLFRQHAAVILARQQALREIRRRIKREGRVPLSTLSYATLTRMAYDLVNAEPELVAEAAKIARELGYEEHCVSKSPVQDRITY